MLEITRSCDVHGKCPMFHAYRTGPFFPYRAVTSMLSALFFPIIPWLMQLILFAWFLAVAVYPLCFCTKTLGDIVLALQFVLNV